MVKFKRNRHWKTEHRSQCKENCAWNCDNHSRNTKKRVLVVIRVYDYVQCTHAQTEDTHIGIIMSKRTCRI